jgi:hypothetical protein
MSAYGTLAMASWFAFFAFLLRGLVLDSRIVELVERRRTEEDPRYVSRWSFWRIRYWSIWSDYRRYYPEGNLLPHYWLTELAAVCFFILSLFFLYRAIK